VLWWVQSILICYQMQDHFTLYRNMQQKMQSNKQSKPCQWQGTRMLVPMSSCSWHSWIHSTLTFPWSPGKWGSKWCFDAMLLCFGKTKATCFRSSALRTLHWRNISGLTGNPVGLRWMWHQGNWYIISIHSHCLEMKFLLFWKNTKVLEIAALGQWFWADLGCIWMH